MSLQSAEPAGVLEINRDEAAEISVAGAAGADAVPVAEPADAVHPAVVDEVEADGAAWPEILEGVGLFRRKGKHDSGWSCFDRLAFRVQTENTCNVLGRGPLHCKWTCSAGMHLFVFWVSGCTQTEAEHRADMPDNGSMRMYKDATCFFHRHFLWSLGNSTLEGKPICVRLSLLFQFARLQVPWS